MTLQPDNCDIIQQAMLENQAARKKKKEEQEKKVQS